ncbi:MAG: serine hydrolase domain-containing protein [Cyanobacteria bacterium P01_A01_bin.135]
MEFAVPALKVPEVSYSAIALELSSILTAYSQADEFSGVVLLRQGDQDLLKAAYGYANRTWGLRNQPDTRFRIASISKVFTATAILQLIERGQLDWNTAVVQPLGLKDTQIPEAVTVYHLLTMTAGIADWFEESGDWAEDWAALCREHPLYLLRRNADYLPLFATKPPGSAVGERYQYNNASYILLGQLIEQVTGLSYFDYVRRHIFTPAQMTQSDFVALDAIHPPVAEGYIPVLNEQAAAAWQKNIYAVTPEAAADGGAVSTVDDLSRFVRSLLAGQLLSPKMTQAMLTPQVLEATDDDYLWHYGFGNQFLLNRAGQVLRWGHTGEEEGVSCRLYYYPQADLQVVILGNQSECAGPLGWEIHDLLAATFKP